MPFSGFIFSFKVFLQACLPLFESDCNEMTENEGRLERRGAIQVSHFSSVLHKGSSFMTFASWIMHFATTSVHMKH